MQALGDLRQDRQISRLLSSGGRMARLVRIGLVAAGSLLALVVIAPGAGAAPGGGTSDADVVFCLSPAQRPHLIDAAAALGLGQPAPRSAGIVVRAGGERTVEELTVEEWRRTRPGDFERTCAALVEATKAVLPAAPGSGSGSGSTLSALLPVIVGAVLTGVPTIGVTVWRDSLARRRAHATALRAAALDFVQAIDGYLGAWIDRGDTTLAYLAVRDRRFELRATARQIADEYRDWQLPRDLEVLCTGPLGEDLATDWRGMDDRQRRDRADLVREELRKVQATAESISRALDLPRHLRWTWRKGGQDRKEARRGQRN